MFVNTSVRRQQCNYKLRIACDYLLFNLKHVLTLSSFGENKHTLFFTSYDLLVKPQPVNFHETNVDVVLIDVKKQVFNPSYLVNVFRTTN